VTRPVVFDAGALIALARRDREMLAAVAVIVSHKIPAYVPAGVIAQVWRGDPRQHDIAVLLKSDAVRVVALDETAAKQVGVLLGRTGTSDVTDGHVALVADNAGGTVYTSDPGDIAAINPALDIETV